MPAELLDFARQAVEQALKDPLALARSLGEYLTEPKANVWFEAGDVPDRLQQVTLARSTRMLYDDKHVFINGEAFRAAGRDAALMRRLADQRTLGPADLARASAGALELLLSWCDDGWLVAGDAP